MAIVCLMTMVAFTSCSKDDSNNEVEKFASVVGLWEATYIKGYYTPNITSSPINFDQEITSNDKNLAIRFEFLPNSIAYEYDFSGKKWRKHEEECFYSINGNRLRIYESGEPWSRKGFNGIYDGNIDNLYTILELTDNTLVLELNGKDSNIARLNGLTDQYVTITFKRIN